MSSETYRLLQKTLSTHFPDTPVHCAWDHPRVPNSMPLDTSATFYDYVILDGKRYHASSTVGSHSSSLIEVEIQGDGPDGVTSRLECAELTEVFRFEQRGSDAPLFFCRVRWFKSWTGHREAIWDDL